MDLGRIFVVGATHGCLGMLKRLMNTIPRHPGKDRLIFVGGYIGRGRIPKE